LFSIINFDIPGAKVLDLFGGTGQLGIEALSRGAASAVFVDVREESCKLTRENLKRTKLEQDAKVVRSDYLDYLKRCREKYDIIFLDPPYNKGFLTPVIEKIFEKHLLSDDGIIVCETEVNGEIYSGGDFKCVKQAKYGKVCVSIYKYA